MFNHLSSTQKGMALAFGGYTAFSFSDTCVKWLAEHGYSIYQIIVVETALASIVLLSFAPLLGGLRSLKDAPNAKIHTLRVFLNTAVNLLIVYCFTLMPLTTIYTAIFTMPFIAALIAMPLYNEKIGLNRWVSIAIGFIGVLIAFQPWAKGTDLVTMALPMLTTLGIASMFVIARSLKGSSPLAVAFYPIAGCCLLVMPFSIPEFQTIAPLHFPLFLMAGCLVSLGILGVSLAFQKADSAVVAPTIYCELLWGILFGALVFGDLPDRWMLIGGGVIIVSGLYLILSERQKA